MACSFLDRPDLLQYHVHEMFEMLDPKRTGTIAVCDLRLVKRVFGINITDEEIDQIELELVNTPLPPDVLTVQGRRATHDVLTSGRMSFERFQKFVNAHLVREVF